jgi:hypothetical protein
MVLRKSITALFQATPFSSTVAPSLGSPAPRPNMSPRRMRPRKSSRFDASSSSCYPFRPLSSATTPQSNSPSTTTTTRGPNTSTSTFTSSGKSSQMAPSHLSTVPWQLTFSPSHCPNGRSQHMCARLGYIAFEGEWRILPTPQLVHQHAPAHGHCLEVAPCLNCVLDSRASCSPTPSSILFD